MKITTCDLCKKEINSNSVIVCLLDKTYDMHKDCEKAFTKELEGRLGSGNKNESGIILKPYNPYIYPTVYPYGWWEYQSVAPITFGTSSNTLTIRDDITATNTYDPSSGYTDSYSLEDPVTVMAVG